MAHDPLGNSDMARLIRAHGWAATPLGPIGEWPERIKAVVELVLASPLVSAVAAGDDRLLIYNDAAARLYGDRHPGALGRPLAETFPDSYPQVAALYDRVYAGESVQVAAQPLAVGTDGGGEVFDAYLSPVRDGDGAVIGAHMIGMEISAKLRADAASRQAETRYLALLHAIDQGFCTIEVAFDADGKAADYRFLEISPSFEHQTGIKDAEGRWMRDIAPDHEQHWFDMYGKVALTGEPAAFENFSTPLGRWWEVFAFRVEHPGDHRVGLLFRDISDRKQAEAALRESEERQAFLLELSDTLRPLIKPGEIERAATRLLGEHLRADRCFLSPVYDDGTGMCVREEYLRSGASSVLGDYTFAQFGDFVGPTLHAGQILAVEDVDALSGLSKAERESYAVTGISAYLLVPVTRGGRLAAFLTINHRTPHAWSDADKAVARQTADRLWTARERALAEAALRESEERLAAAFESVPVGAAVIDKTGTAVLSNAQYRTFLPTGIIPSRDAERGARWRAWDASGKPIPQADYPGARALRGERVVPGLEMVYTDDEGKEIWTNVATAPIHDGAGRVTGAVTAISDVTEAKRAALALGESEERLRQFGELSQDVLWIRDSETFQWEYLTPAFETIYGMTRESALRGDNMTGWLELILPEDREHAKRSLARVCDGEWVTFQFRFRRPSDGGIRYMRNTDFPIRDATGKVVRIGGIGHDITPLKVSEQALAAAEERQRVLIEGIPQLVWRAVDGGRWTWASPQWTAFTGQAEADSHDLGWLDPVHPDDRADVRDIWVGAVERGGFRADYRIRHGETGHYHWFQTGATPVRDAGGTIIEWLGTSTDVDDLRRLQERQQVLLSELQHRVRNILAIIRSIMRRSLDGEQSLQDYAQHLEGRIAALARTQVLLTRYPDANVDLEEVVRDELMAQAADESRIEVSGPDVELPSKAAEVLALAMHELATNSVKYGAIAHSEASLRIEWSLEDRNDGRWLTVVWTETGVPVAGGSPGRTGFGTELITRRVPYELRGSGDLVIKRGGIVCTIAFPLKDRASILETGSAAQTYGDRP